MQSSKVERMQEIIKLLTPAKTVYYNTGEQIMENATYDALEKELSELEEETGIILSNSPIHSVGAIAQKGETYIHPVPALSLAKEKEAEKEKYLSELAKGGGDAVLEWKMDGSTGVAYFEPDSSGYATLVRFVTRGDGYSGEVITDKLPIIGGIPIRLPVKGNVVVRGEICMSYTEFNRINSLLPEEDWYANPRNLATGTVNADEVIQDRKLMFFAFTLVEVPNMPETTSKRLDMMQQMGFNVVPYEVCSMNTLGMVMAAWGEKVKTFDYPVDGLVTVLEDAQRLEDLHLKGTERNPHIFYGYAFKWKDEMSETVLREIVWKTSRTGRINPRGRFDTVNLEGTEVTYATLNNISFIEGLRLAVGARIGVYKANKIIPAIGMNYDIDSITDAQISESIVKVCPCCGSVAEIRIGESGSKMAYCPNENCSSRNINKFVHFASRKCMDIDGMSEKTIEKFVELGFINQFADFFRLANHRAEIIALDGFGEKLYNQLITSIEKSRTVTFVKFLPSLGIPNIGTGQAREIANAYNDEFYDFLGDVYFGKDFTFIPKIGSVLSQSLVEWGKKNPYEEGSEIFELLSEVTFEKAKSTGQKLAGLTFVITGSVHHFSNRDALKAVIEENGGKTSGSVSKNTSYLINNDVNSTSGKNKTALSLGIKIISEDEFLKML